MPNLVGDSNNPNVAAVLGNNTDGGTGVVGVSTSGTGVVGGSRSGTGIQATSSTHIALYAQGGGFPPVLVVQHIGSGRLIAGLNQEGNEVFMVFNNGDVWAHGVKLTSDKNVKNLERQHTRDS